MGSLGSSCTHSTAALVQALVQLLLLFAIATCANAQAGFQQYAPTGTIEANPSWGSVGTPLVYFQTPQDAVTDDLFKAGRPSARAISSALIGAPFQGNRSRRGGTDILTYMGQFVAHDILQVVKQSGIFANISVPRCDPTFDPPVGSICSGNISLAFQRSNATCPVSNQKCTKRGPLNFATAFIDGDSIYGRTTVDQVRLRDNPSAYLRLSKQGLLPSNAELAAGDRITMQVEPTTNRTDMNVMKVAGDPRVNMHPMVLALQTVFVREHNRLVDDFKRRAISSSTAYTPNTLFDLAKRWNIAQLQAIVYNEYIPRLGVVLPDYKGYNATVNPSVDAFFATVAYRYGHSEVGNEILRLDEDRNVIPEGNLELAEVYFNPDKALSAGIDPLLRGMAHNLQYEVDIKFDEAIENFLFASTGAPGHGGMDLTARNIQRGRDHGIPDYFSCRQSVLQTFQYSKTIKDITTDPAIQALLEQVYEGNADLIDAYVGGLAEEHYLNSNLGELFYKSLVEQYTRSRDGDPWFYARSVSSGGVFSDEEIATLKQTRLRDLIIRNTGIRKLYDNIWIRGAFEANTSISTETNTLRLATDKYTLKWAFLDAEKSVVNFEVTASGRGWVGLGFAACKGCGMPGADLMRGGVYENGTAYLLDMFALRYGTPELDSTAGGKSDLMLVFAKEEQIGSTWYTTLNWTRASITGDKEGIDWPLVANGLKTNVVFAWHNTSDDLDYHGATNRAQAEIDFFNFRNNGVSAANTAESSRGQPGGASSSGGSSPVGAIAGVAVGVVLVALIAVAVLLFVRRRRSRAMKASAEKLAGTPVNAFDQGGKGAPSDLYGPPPLPLHLHSEEPHSSSSMQSRATAEYMTDSGRLVADHSRKGSVGSVTGSDNIEVPGVRKYGLREILDATNHFSQANEIGRGGFGSVYLGRVPLEADASMSLSSEAGDAYSRLVAVKRADKVSQQGYREFRSEVMLLSRLHHQNLVRLLGYCQEGDQQILVYEYMAQGTLRSHLTAHAATPLSWRQRLEVAFGAAKGIDYLHTGASPPVIHRDVKSTNILLSADMCAKVSDFGMSRATGRAEQLAGHASTAVQGTLGYFDPEYMDTQWLSEKSDVYAFGVVLVELLTGRAPYDRSLPPHEINLAKWARDNLTSDVEATLPLLEPALQARSTEDSVMMVVQLARQCLALTGNQRPTMSMVVLSLVDAIRTADGYGRPGQGHSGGDMTGVDMTMDSMFAAR